MPEDTARRLAEIREAFDCSVADYNMDPGDTGFLLGIIDTQQATIDALTAELGALRTAGDALAERVLSAFAHGEIAHLARQWKEATDA